MSPPSPAHPVRPHRRAYKRRRPPAELSTPSHSPLLTDRSTPFPEQGEQRIARISPEPAASGEEGRHRFRPPQELPRPPLSSPSSTSSFARLADPRLNPGEPPTTPTGRARFLSRRRCPTSTMTLSRWIRIRSNAPHRPIPLRTPVSLTSGDIHLNSPRKRYA